MQCGRTDGGRGLRWTDRGEYSGLSSTENVRENEASAGRNEGSLSGLVSEHCRGRLSEQTAVILRPKGKP